MPRRSLPRVRAVRTHSAVTYRLVRVFPDGRRQTVCTGIESKETADELADAITKSGNLAIIAEVDEPNRPATADSTRTMV